MRFKTNEVGCIVDYEDGLKNYDGQKEILELLNRLAEENKNLNELCIGQTKALEFAYQFIANVLNENIDTMYAMKTIMKETVSALELLSKTLKEVKDDESNTNGQ